VIDSVWLNCNGPQKNPFPYEKLSYAYVTRNSLTARSGVAVIADHTAHDGISLRRNTYGILAN